MGHKLDSVIGQMADHRFPPSLSQLDDLIVELAEIEESGLFEAALLVRGALAASTDEYLSSVGATSPRDKCLASLKLAGLGPLGSAQGVREAQTRLARTAKKMGIRPTFYR